VSQPPAPTPAPTPTPTPAPVPTPEPVATPDVDAARESVADADDAQKTLDMQIPADAADFNGHSYKLFDTGLTWHEAKNYCESLGGYLSTISSQSENDFIKNYIISLGYRDACLGASDEVAEGMWKWVTGEPFVYSNWGRGEPNNERGREHYLLFNSDDYWNDIPDEKWPFICEWDNINTSSNPIGQLSQFSPSNHSYAFYDNASSWDEARTYCESLGGHLATLTSKEENDYVYRLLVENGHTGAYFGLSDSEQEGAWKWVAGEPFAYNNWHSGEPNAENSNEDYAMFYWRYDDGTWNDGDFGGRTVQGGTVFICEWDL
jgi:hypothetical protein